MGEGRTILRCATVHNSEFYAAVEHNNKVFAFVALIQWAPKSHFNFTYKTMHEADGPSVSRCPDAILKLLSPVDDLPASAERIQWARIWRDQCRDSNLRRAAARRVKPGMTLRFTDSLPFSDGESADTFVFEQRSSFRRCPDGVRCSIRNWRGRSFAIVGEGE